MELQLTDYADAPETITDYAPLDHLYVRAKQYADVWSLGCVFSEAATWSRFGWDRVVEYRQQRLIEVKQLLDLEDEPIFHDCQSMLPTVQKMHEQISKEASVIDFVPVEILRLLDQDILINRDESRLSARQFLSRSKRVIQAARKDYRVREEGAGDISDAEERPKTPPSVPPGYLKDSKASAQKPLSIPTGIFSSVTTSTDSVLPYSRRRQSTTASGQDVVKAENGSSGNHGINSSAEVSHPVIPSSHNPINSPHPATSNHSLDFDRLGTPSMGTKAQDHSQGNNYQYRKTMSNLVLEADSHVHTKPEEQEPTSSPAFLLES